MQLNNIDRTSTRGLGNRFDKSVYEQFKSFGILLRVEIINSLMGVGRTKLSQIFIILTIIMP